MDYWYSYYYYPHQRIHVPVAFVPFQPPHESRPAAHEMAAPDLATSGELRSPAPLLQHGRQL